jgi:hypothetical protein
MFGEVSCRKTTLVEQVVPIIDDYILAFNQNLLELHLMFFVMLIKNNNISLRNCLIKCVCVLLPTLGMESLNPKGPLVDPTRVYTCGQHKCMHIGTRTSY